MATTAAEQAIVSRLEAIERFVASNRIAGAPGLADRNLAKIVLDMEIVVSTLVDDPLSKMPKCK